MSRLTRALQHRNYRLFFGGQSISLIGTWITRIATSWLVYRLTGSELLLGVVGFAGQIPLLVLAPFAGVLVDRWNRHRMLVITQILSALQSLALALLAFTHITVTEIILLQIAQGIINAFDTPARQAFVVEMVDRREDLPNAIALNSSMFNASRIIGPSIGGLLIAVVGEGWCFMADAISYIAVILSLLAMRFNRAPVVRRQTRMLEELRSGVAYTFGFPPVRALLADVAIIGTFGMMYTTLAPVIASRVLHGGPHTLGLLMTASGLGALLGTFYLAARHTVLGLGKVIVAATVALSFGLAAFAFTQHLWLALLVLPVIGAGLMLSSSSANTILQTVVTEELRGRVMAFYSVAVLGTQPFGSLLAGILGDRIGTQNTILLSAIVCLFTSVWFGIRRPALAEHIKPIYLELGILESVDPVVVEES
jgi:MFS family permease